MSFGWGSGSLRGHGDITFNESVTLYDPDGSVSVRQMNPNGGFYDAVEELYEDDDSLHLSDVDDAGGDDGDCFLDALQEQLLDDEEGGTLLVGDDDDDLGMAEDYFYGTK